MYIHDIQQYIKTHRHPGFYLCIYEVQQGNSWTIECRLNDMPAAVQCFLELEHTIVSHITAQPKTKHYVVTVPFVNGYLRPGRYTYDRNANQLI